jgi:hypothetical protein
VDGTGLLPVAPTMRTVSCEVEDMVGWFKDVLERKRVLLAVAVRELGLRAFRRRMAC